MSVHRIGQRLSLRGDRLTVRYVGQLDGRPGEWLGVEWDDPIRGKHSGQFAGKQYFTCKSLHKTCASFLSPDSAFDHIRSIHEAIHDKYGGDESIDIDTVRISGKTVEEKGYDKISRRQRRFIDIRFLNLSEQRVALASPESDGNSVHILCPDVRDLDLGWNLIENLTVIESVLGESQSIRHLSLQGNRLQHLTCQSTFGSVTHLNLDSMLLSPQELEQLIRPFPCLAHLSATNNKLDGLKGFQMTGNIASLDLSHNHFQSLQEVMTLVAGLSQLNTLGLKGNAISLISASAGLSATARFQNSLTEIDLSLNDISDWAFVDSLHTLVPKLQHLRLSQNPIYGLSKYQDDRPLTGAEVSMAIAARLPNLQSLNFTAITTKDRTGAESYYLSLIAEELAAADIAQESVVLARHPRYLQLCREYGKPMVTRKTDEAMNPTSIAARLVHIDLVLPDSTKPSDTIKVPSSFSVYSLYSYVGRYTGQDPTDFQLTWETGEKAPRGDGIDVQQSIVEWDSEEDETEQDWVAREESLTPGTRPLASVFVSGAVRVRLDSL